MNGESTGKEQQNVEDRTAALRNRFEPPVRREVVTIKLTSYERKLLRELIEELHRLNPLQEVTADALIGHLIVEGYRGLSLFAYERFGITVRGRAR